MWLVTFCIDLVSFLLLGKSGFFGPAQFQGGIVSVLIFFCYYGVIRLNKGRTPFSVQLSVVPPCELPRLRDRMQKASWNFDSPKVNCVLCDEIFK